jgi:hypothetical protein
MSAWANRSQRTTHPLGELAGIRQRPQAEKSVGVCTRQFAPKRGCDDQLKVTAIVVQAGGALPPAGYIGIDGPCCTGSSMRLRRIALTTATVRLVVPNFRIAFLR